MNETGTKQAWWLALGALALLGCGPRQLRVTMNADNHSGQAGFALITELSNGVRVEFETSMPDAAPQPAHVHHGTCGEVGDKAFGLRTAVEDPARPGRFVSVTELTSANIGEATVDGKPVDQKYLKLSALLETPHLINLHDPRDVGIYVSCGEIHE